MIWCQFRKAVLTAAVLAVTAIPSFAGDASCCDPCSGGTAGVGSAGCCGPTTRKVLVTEYVSQQYETTRTSYKTEDREEKYKAYKTEYKTEKYTAYKNEIVPETRSRKVTYTKSVPTTKDVVVTRIECVPVEEERTVTRCVTSCKPVTENVKQTVDVGGHYEEKEVLVASGSCNGGCNGGGHGHKLFGKLFGGHKGTCSGGSGCGGCNGGHGCTGSSGCDGGHGCNGGTVYTTSTVKTYVPKYETKEVPVTTMKSFTETVTEKIKVKVMKQVEKKETVKVTSYECVTETKDETYTVNVCRQVAYEASRQVPVCVAYDAVRTVKVCVPVTEKVMATRMVPVQVEKEVLVSCCESDSGHGGHKLFGRFRCHSCK